MMSKRKAILEIVWMEKKKALERWIVDEKEPIAPSSSLGLWKMVKLMGREENVMPETGISIKLSEIQKCCKYENFSEKIRQQVQRLLGHCPNAPKIHRSPLQ